MTLRRDRRLLLSLNAVVAVLLVVAPSSSALAAWSAGGPPGSAAGAGALMPTGTTPSGSDVGSSVTIRWTAVTFANGAAVAGYTVTRTNANTSVPATVGGGCNGVVTATTCTEFSVPAGTWVYTETPVESNWTGSSSPESPPIVVS